MKDTMSPEKAALKKETMKVHAKLGFNQQEAEAIVEALNRILANYQVHYQKLRNYHWNVKGGDFFDIHENFEMLYTEVAEHIDQIAEHIRVFNKTPLSTLREYLEISIIQETTRKMSEKKW